MANGRQPVRGSGLTARASHDELQALVTRSGAKLRSATCPILFIPVDANINGWSDGRGGLPGQEPAACVREWN